MRSQVPHRIYFIAALLSSAAAAWGQLPQRHPVDGELLAKVAVEGGYTAGIYGPRPATAGETALLTFVLMGSDAATLSSGLVAMAVPHETVTVRETPMPEGSYIPPGQWSEQGSEWRQLMPLSPQSFWLTNLTTLAPPSFSGREGTLLDLVAFAPDLPQPGADSALRDLADSDRVGAVFSLTEGDTPAAGEASGALPPREAHGVKIAVPVLIKEPNTAITFLLIFTSHGKHTLIELPASLSAGARAAAQAQTGPGVAVISSPAAGAEVTSPVLVSGKTQPGMMVAAWLEARRGGAEGTLLNDPAQVVRRLADDRGQFEVPVPAPLIPPAAAAEPGAITTFLHVRTEAPGYFSPEDIREVEISAPAETTPATPAAAEETVG